MSSRHTSESGMDGAPVAPALPRSSLSADASAYVPRASVTSVTTTHSLSGTYMNGTQYHHHLPTPSNNTNSYSNGPYPYESMPSQAYGHDWRQVAQTAYMPHHEESNISHVPGQAPYPYGMVDPSSHMPVQYMPQHIYMNPHAPLLYRPHYSHEFYQPHTEGGVLEDSQQGPHLGGSVDGSAPVSTGKSSTTNANVLVAASQASSVPSVTAVPVPLLTTQSSAENAASASTATASSTNQQDLYYTQTPPPNHFPPNKNPYYQPRDQLPCNSSPGSSMVTVQNSNVHVFFCNQATSINQSGPTAPVVQAPPAGAMVQQPALNPGIQYAHLPSQPFVFQPDYQTSTAPPANMANFMYNRDASVGRGHARGTSGQRGSSVPRRPRRSEGDRSSVGSNVEMIDMNYEFNENEMSSNEQIPQRAMPILVPLVYPQQQQHRRVMRPMPPPVVRPQPAAVPVRPHIVRSDDSGHSSPDQHCASPNTTEAVENIPPAFMGNFDAGISHGQAYPQSGNLVSSTNSSAVTFNATVAPSTASVTYSADVVSATGVSNTYPAVEEMKQCYTTSGIVYTSSSVVQSSSQNVQMCTVSAAPISSAPTAVPEFYTNSVPAKIDDSNAVAVGSVDTTVSPVPVYEATVTAHHQTTKIPPVEIIMNVNKQDVPSKPVDVSELQLGSELASELTHPIFTTNVDSDFEFSMSFGDFKSIADLLENLKIVNIQGNSEGSAAQAACVSTENSGVTSAMPVFDTANSTSATCPPGGMFFGYGDDVEQSKTANVKKEEKTVAQPTQSSAPAKSRTPLAISATAAKPAVSQPTVSSGSVKPAASQVNSRPAVEPTSVVSSEKPPLPSKKQQPPQQQPQPPQQQPQPPQQQQQQQQQQQLPQSSEVVTPVQQATEAPAPSAWGKKKNWNESFKGNCVDQPKQVKTAVVTPMVRNGAMVTSTETDPSSANVTHNSGATAAPCQVSACNTTSPAAAASDSDVIAKAAPVDDVAVIKDRIKIGYFLADHKADSSNVLLQPRGLTNKNYWCYCNTVLQALTAIPQFINLYESMQEEVGPRISEQTIPVSHSIISYLQHLSPMNPGAINLTVRPRKKAGQNIVNLPEVQLGDPFEPSSIQKLLLDKNSGQFTEGCQQDAEEMLSFVLNALHDEFNDLIKLSTDDMEKLTGRKTPAAVVYPNGGVDDDDNNDDDWVTMGPKNKSCITRTTEFTHSPISEIFWGESRSIIKKGNSPVTNNLEPFITLPLDIQDEGVTSVKEALAQFVSKADVAGYTCTDTQEELTVSSQRLLEQLPQVLILQLKRFVYSVNGGLQKVTKDISLSIDLEISKDLISQQRRKKLSGEKTKYKLVSVIYHDGKDANKGHYVCNAYHPGYHCWLHYDDACVKPIVSGELQRFSAPRVPYLLFYRRVDTFAEGTMPCAIQNTLPNRRRNKDKRNSSVEIPASDSIDPVTKASEPPQVVENNSRKSSIDRKHSSLERKGSNQNKPNTHYNNTSNKKQDKKQGKKQSSARN